MPLGFQCFAVPAASVSILFLTSPATAQPKAETTTSKGGVVVCVSPAAADVSLATLKKGGNAVDAAVATAFAMAVTWPEAGNIGGGGFMMVAPPDKELTCFEYRETAPAAAKVDLLADGKVTSLDHKAAGVPGTVRGLALAHQKFGKLKWEDVVMPAVELAEKGFPITAPLANDLNSILASPLTKNDEFKRVFGKPKGEKWKAGDTLVQKDLAHTLQLVAEKGADAFYTGELAELLEKEMKAGGGLITKADLEAYKANERKPIHTTFRGFDVYGPPPPSSGGIVVAEVLNILEDFDLKKQGRWSPETMHLMIEAMKRWLRRPRALPRRPGVHQNSRGTHDEGVREETRFRNRLEEADTQQRPRTGNHVRQRERQHNAFLGDRQRRPRGEQHIYAGKQLG